MCILPFLRFDTKNYKHLLDLHHVVPWPNFRNPHVAINHFSIISYAVLPPVKAQG